MNIIENNWWLWLIGSFITTLYIGYNQLSRMHNMMISAFDKKKESFMDGLYLLFLAVALDSMFSGLFTVSIILNIISFYKK
jgi:hypothetical protein